VCVCVWVYIHLRNESSDAPPSLSPCMPPSLSTYIYIYTYIYICVYLRHESSDALAIVHTKLFFFLDTECRLGTHARMLFSSLKKRQKRMLQRPQARLLHEVL
jgi:hypothetical protein